MTTKTEAPKEPTAPTRRGLLRRIIVWSGRVGAVALIGATVYLGVMAVMWNMHVGELTSIKNDLADQKTTSEEGLEDATARLEATREDLDDSLTSIIDFADDKAQAQDNQILFEDLASFMEECADETVELVKVTYDRFIYTYSSLKAYENSVRDYCNEVSDAIEDLIDETEGEGS